MSEILNGLLTILVLIIGAWCRTQEGKIRDLEKNGKQCDKDREALRKDVMDRWVKDAETYVTKTDFNSLAREIKDSLVRIEDKIEKLRG